MDSSRSAEAPSLSPEAVDFVRFCYRRRKVGWPELYDEMCAVAGRGLYRGWRFTELEEHGIGFSLHQTLELARIASQVAAEEGDRRGRVGRAIAEPATPGPGSIEVRVVARPAEPVIDVPILAAVDLDIAAAGPAVAGSSDGEDAVCSPDLVSTVGVAAAQPAPDPAATPASTPTRPALSPSMIRSAAGAS